MHSQGERDLKGTRAVVGIGPGSGLRGAVGNRFITTADGPMNQSES